MPAGKPDYNDSLSSSYRNGLRYLSRQFNFCYYQESSVFGHYYPQDVTSMASSYVEGVLVSAGRRRESRVSPRVGEVVERGKKEDWADVERF
jgi:hypothetical protein